MKDLKSAHYLITALLILCVVLLFFIVLKTEKVKSLENKYLEIQKVNTKLQDRNIYLTELNKLLEEK